MRTLEDPRANFMKPNNLLMTIIKLGSYKALYHTPRGVPKRSVIFPARFVELHVLKYETYSNGATCNQPNQEHRGEPFPFTISALGSFMCIHNTRDLMLYVPS